MRYSYLITLIFLITPIVALASDNCDYLIKEVDRHSRHLDESKYELFYRAYGNAKDCLKKLNGSLKFEEIEKRVSLIVISRGPFGRCLQKLVDEMPEEKCVQVLVSQNQKDICSTLKTDKSCIRRAAARYCGQPAVDVLDKDEKKILDIFYC